MLRGETKRQEKSAQPRVAALWDAHAPGKATLAQGLRLRVTMRDGIELEAVRRVCWW